MGTGVNERAERWVDPGKESRGMFQSIVFESSTICEKHRRILRWGPMV